MALLALRLLAHGVLGLGLLLEELLPVLQRLPLFRSISAL